MSRDDPTKCSECGSTELEQDPDVLDTWFSSQLWPFSVFGWPTETEDMKAFYPGHTMVTAPEILFFWVARMIMMGYEFQGEPPFTQVYLHGTVRDMQGRKMSKSLGNGIDPLEVVDAFGADAMRYTIISQCGVGSAIHLDHENIELAFSSGRNFANKIWNAGRFSLMSLGDEPVKPLAEVDDALELEDRWIISRVQKATANATDGLERFRLHEVAEGLYHFFWGEVCDWYLELVKSRLGSDADPVSREAARSALLVVMDSALRLLHQIVPFVTTELWARLPCPAGHERAEDLIVAPWPTPNEDLISEGSEGLMTTLQELVTEVRRLRKEYGVPEGRLIGIYVSGATDSFVTAVKGQSAALEQLAGIQGIESDVRSGVGAHGVLSNGAELFMPLEGVIDLDRERERLNEAIGRLDGLLEGAKNRLENEAFVSRAPKEVVQKEHDKAAQLEEQRVKLRIKLDGLEATGSE